MQKTTLIVLYMAGFVTGINIEAIHVPDESFYPDATACYISIGIAIVFGINLILSEN